MPHTPQPSEDSVDSKAFRRQIALGMINGLPTPLTLIDKTCKVIGANTAWIALEVADFGIALERGQFPPEQLSEIRTSLDAVFSGEKEQVRLHFPQGVLRDDEESVVEVRLLDKSSGEAIVILQNDPTEAERPDDAIDGEVDAEPALFETDLEGRIVSWSAGAKELFGKDESSVLSEHANILIAKGDFEFPDQDLLRGLRKGRTQRMDLRLKRSSGSFFDGQIVIDIQTYGDGTRMICEASIVSDRQRAGALRRSEERLRYALEAASDGIWDWNVRTGRVVLTSRASEMLGGDEGRRSTHIESWNARIHPDDTATHRKNLSAHFEGLTPTFESEYRLGGDEDENKWVVVRGRATERDAAGSPLRLIGTITDISERKFAQDALRRSEEQYRDLFEHANDAVVLSDVENGVIIDANDKAEDIFGYPASELKRMTIGQLHPQDHADRLQKAFDTADQGKGRLVEVDGLAQSGKRVPLEANIRRVNYGGRTAYQSFIRDISERLALESQLRQSQRMETVGRLAGGIAHDFNNILTAIQGYTTLLRSALPEDSEEREMADEVTRSVQRASRLTMQLLTFSRRDMPDPVQLNVNVIVEETEKMLRQIIGEHIDLAMDLDSNLGMVRGDGGSIEQVITNLVVNAADAMPDGGTISISTGDVTLEDQSPMRPAEAEPGDYILLSVQDEGAGILPELMPRIFEPFFTTKESGTGTGLGLATVYGIIKRSKGYISVDSRPQEGTRFRIYLPRTGESSEPGQVVSETPVVVPGDETILVVEDEPAVRHLARKFLEVNGYTVVEARDAAEAMNAVQDHVGTIDLLLTDVIMPLLSGPELAKRLRERQPDLKVLYMSGYPGEFIERHGVTQQEQGYLQKPFSSDALAIKTREVLDA
jgi:two-component system cell cycle sensor histidine kinase/response regulator CckA